MTAIVITGAASPLGSFAVRHLSRHTTHEIVAITSRRASEGLAGDEHRVRWLRRDLRAPLEAGDRALIGAAHRVLHFAWTRDGSEGEVRTANMTMIRNVVSASPDPSRLWFVSSVSASPGAFSVYGKVKFDCANAVDALGGGVLVCGLVVEEHPTRGPYKMLCDTVAKVPFALRAVAGEPRVFPIRLDDLGGALERIVDADIAPAKYQVFSSPVPLNSFLRLLEDLKPRARLKLPFSARRAIRAISMGKRLGVLPERLSDQLMTFLYKDEAYLMSHRELPGAVFRPCTSIDFFRGT